MDEFDFLIKKSLSEQIEPDYYLLMKTKQQVMQKSEKDGKLLFVLSCVMSIMTIMLVAVAVNVFLYSLFHPFACLLVNGYCLLLFCAVFIVLAMEGTAKRTSLRLLPDDFE